MKIRHGLSYAWSWIRADLIGLTVCKVLSHRPPSTSLWRFTLQLDDLFGNTNPENRRQTCMRCGAFIS